MTKIAFTQEQQLDLTRRLQLMLLDAIQASGNWSNDEIRFQGGTCLSLVYGSSRFSEDLDFILGTDRGLKRMLASASARLTDSLRTLLPGATVKFVTRDKDMESDDAKNPRVFMMSVSHPDWYRVVKVKVEFWVCDPEAVASYESGVRTANVLSAVATGSPLRATIAPVFVNAATLDEIVVDKLHALSCREYMKHRDVFDLWWLREQGVKRWASLLEERYENHARMYADSPTLPELGERLTLKAQEIAAMIGQPAFSNDLKQWLGERSTLASQTSADAIAKSVVDGLHDCVNDLAAHRKSAAKSVRP